MNILYCWVNTMEDSQKYYEIEILTRELKEGKEAAFDYLFRTRYKTCVVLQPRLSCSLTWRKTLCRKFLKRSGKKVLGLTRGRLLIVICLLPCVMLVLRF